MLLRLYGALCDGAMNHNRRSIYKGLILYAEDEKHKNAMQIIEKNYKYKAILHDRDTDENGEIKKPHFHYIIKCDNSCPNSTIATALGITENYIQVILSLKGAYDYLTHKYSKDKFQYSSSDLFGDLEIEDTDKDITDFVDLMQFP